MSIRFQILNEEGGIVSSNDPGETALLGPGSTSLKLRMIYKMSASVKLNTHMLAINKSNIMINEKIILIARENKTREGLCENSKVIIGGFDYRVFNVLFLFEEN